MLTLFPKDNRPGPDENPRPAVRTVAKLRSTRFALRLFEALAPGNENLAISPYGARILLSLLWSGAAGVTQKQMADVLELATGDDSNENWYERLGRPLRLNCTEAEHGEEFLAETCLWSDQEFTLNEAFVQEAKTKYAAELQRADFNSESSAERVNSWVREKTRGKISRIVGKLAPLAPLLAVNAVYFRGKWLTPFEKDLTRQEKFFLPDAKPQLVPMMRQSESFAYAERNGTQIASLPYLGSLRMLVILPPQGVRLDTFCRELHETVGPDWRRLLQSRPGNLRLPRFRIESDLGLDGALRALGVSQAFDRDHAEFGKISNVNPFFLGALRQKDFVEVDEEGTEAAAVTSAVFCLSSLQPELPPPPFEMIVNRPFVFAICDSFTGVIFFLGTVVNPLPGA